LPSVCQYIQPSTVLGQYYDFNYTDVVSVQDMPNDTCEIKYYYYGPDEPVAMCTSKFQTDWYSSGWQYVGEITEFDILINSYYTWVTGQFETPDVYDREHSMRHELAHAVGCGHTSASQLMDNTNNQSNPVRDISAIDYDIYRLIPNPAGTIETPQESAEGYYDVLLEQDRIITIEAIKPANIVTNSSGLAYYSLNEDLSYHDCIELDNEYGIVESDKYVLQWMLDTLEYSNKVYNVRTMSRGYPILNAGKPFVELFPHDELKIRFSDLTFESPVENGNHYMYSPLDFKVFGLSDTTHVPITDFENIGTVTYRLEEDALLYPDIFEIVTYRAGNFELSVDINSYGLEAGDYLATAIVKDTLGVLVSEIERMPIILTTDRQCYVTYPPSLDDPTAFFDFELPLTIDGYIEAEPAFRDTLEADIVLVEGYINDYRRGLWIYEQEYTDSNYFCDPAAYIYSSKEGEKPLFEYKESNTNIIPDRNHSKKKFNRVKPTISNQIESEISNINLNKQTNHFQYKRSPELQRLNDYYTTVESESKSFAKNMVQFDTTYYNHATSLNLYPGRYWIEAGAYYKYNLWEVIAGYENVDFIIPNWKLKLVEDTWHTGAVPHNSKREYAQGKNVQLITWRPFSQSVYNVINISITRDTDDVEVASFEMDYNLPAKRYVYWETTGATEPGFYTITATEQF
jgi:hypothetical protein